MYDDWSAPLNGIKCTTMATQLNSVHHHQRDLHGKKSATANHGQTRLTIEGRWMNVANVWKLMRITVDCSPHSSKSAPQPTSGRLSVNSCWRCCYCSLFIGRVACWHCHRRSLRLSSRLAVLWWLLSVSGWPSVRRRRCGRWRLEFTKVIIDKGKPGELFLVDCLDDGRVDGG